MSCIFASKALLDKEYKQLFLERLSSTSKLKECIKGRYDKKEITEAELNSLFTNNHKKIFAFIGSGNEHRIRYFFNASSKDDSRDNQIRLIDRLILDSIHFDVINTLMMRFSDEYAQNQSEIDKEWDTEVQNYVELGPLPSFIIIQNAIKLNKTRVFQDLIFPKHRLVELFKLEDQRIIPNKDVFENWLSESDSQRENILTKYIVFAAIASLVILVLIVALPWCITGMGTAFATSLSPHGLVVGVFVGLFLTAGINSVVTGVFNKTNNLIYRTSIDDEQPSYNFSTELMMTKLPKSSQGQALQTIVPPDEGELALFKIKIKDETPQCQIPEFGTHFKL